MIDLKRYMTPANRYEGLHLRDVVPRTRKGKTLATLAFLAAAAFTNRDVLNGTLSRWAYGVHSRSAPKHGEINGKQCDFYPQAPDSYHAQILPEIMLMDKEGKVRPHLIVPRH